jgi:hypothetical protein
MWIRFLILLAAAAFIAAAAYAQVTGFDGRMIMSSSGRNSGVTAGNGAISSIQIAPAGTAYFTNNMNESWIVKNNLATFGNAQYLCYYNTVGPPPVPQFLIRNLTTNAITQAPASGLPAPSFTAPADDEHGNCSIAIDTAGFMHISYGQHGTAPGGLIYYRSNNPVTSTTVGGPFTKHSMVAANASTVETSATYPYFTQNPTTGALYFTFRYFGSGNGNQYFYSYNTGTSTWSAATGTATCQGVGCLINDMANSPATSPYLNGIPKWDAAGKLWFNWEEDNGSGLMQNQYLLAWNGTTFQDAYGNTTATPVVSTSVFAPVLAISTTTGLVVQNDFTINNGVFYIPYSRTDGSGHFQVYVAESSTGVFVEHVLTSNTVNPPVGCGDSTGNGVIQCTTRLTAVGNSNGSVYVTYSDIYSTPPGQGVMAAKSSNSFANFTTSVLISRYLPNFALNPDPTRTGSVASFMVMDSADHQYGYFASSTPPYTFTNQGSMRIYEWMLSYAPGTPANLTVTGGGGGIACAVGPNYMGSIPAPAAKAGYNTCILNFDMSNAAFALTSTWLDCAMSSGTPVWYNTGYNAGPTACGDYTVVSDTVNSVVRNVLDMAYTAADHTSSPNTWMSSVNTAQTAGRWYANGMYYDITFELLPASVAVYAAAPHCLPNSGGVYCELMDFFSVNANSRSGADFQEFDTVEVNATTDFGTYSGPVPPYPYTYTNNPFTYNTYGSLITSDGSTSIVLCGYFNGTGIACSSGLRFNGAHFAYNEGQNVGGGPGSGNTFPCPCPTPSQTQHMRVASIHIFSCATAEMTLITKTSPTTQNCWTGLVTSP